MREARLTKGGEAGGEEKIIIQRHKMKVALVHDFLKSNGGAERVLKKLSELLEKANISIARRTVTKYREMLHILPSTKRKQF